MAFNPLAGIQGSVKIGAVSYAFHEWTLNMGTKVLLVNNFTGASFQQTIPGVTKAELTLNALTYDRGNMPFVTGTKYAFILGYDSVTSVTVTIQVETIEAGANYDELEPIRIIGQSDGVFTSAIS